MEITGAWALSLPFGPTTKSRLYQGSACSWWIRPRDCSHLGRAPSSHWLTSSSPPFHGLRQGCSSFFILGTYSKSESGFEVAWSVDRESASKRGAEDLKTTGVAWCGKWRLWPDQASQGTWFEADFAITVSQETCQNWEIRHKNPGFWVVLKIDRHGHAIATFACCSGRPELSPGCLCILAWVLESHCPSCSLLCRSWPPASSLRVFIGAQLPRGT